MKILWADKDGGPDSNVHYYGLEFKNLFSIAVLCFGKGSRPVYHSHAFRSISWVLTGGLRENQLLNHPDGLGVFAIADDPQEHLPSFRPIHTYRTTYHMVEGIQDQNWVISLRGPWKDKWHEYHPDVDKSIVLTHGRKVV